MNTEPVVGVYGHGSRIHPGFDKLSLRQTDFELENWEDVFALSGIRSLRPPIALAQGR